MVLLPMETAKPLPPVISVFGEYHKPLNFQDWPLLSFRVQALPFTCSP